MALRIVKLIRNEMFKMFRLKLTYFSLACGVAIILIWGGGADYFFTEGSQPGAGYHFFLVSNQTVISFLGVILILIFSALLISSETASGTLQMNLVNSISRLEFLIAKLITGWFFSILFVLSVALPALAIGGLHFGYGNYTEEGLTLFTQWQIFKNIIFCYLLLLAVLLAYVSYGLLISVLTGNTGYAIGLSVGSVLFLDLVCERLKISSYLFQTYVETPFDIVKSVTEGFDITWKPDIYPGLGVPLAWAVACFTAAFFVFSRKDYKS